MRILLILWASMLLAYGGGTLTSGNLTHEEAVSEGFEYQLTAAGTFDSQTVTVKFWNATLGAYSGTTTLTSAAPSATVRATGPRIQFAVAGGSPTIAVQGLRLPAGGSSASANVNSESVSSAIAAFDGTQAAAGRTGLRLGTAATADMESFSSVPMTARFVIEGDSITNPNLLSYPEQTSWVPFFEDLPNCKGRGTVSNVAVSGSTSAQIVSRYAANVYPLRPQSGERVYLITLSGANDSGASAAAYLAVMEPYWTQAKADGFTVVAITQLPFGTATIDMSNGVRSSLVPDIIIDLGNVFYSSYDTYTFLGDNLHLTAYGAELLAKAVDNQIVTKANPTNKILNTSQKGIGIGTVSPKARIHAIDSESQIRLGNTITANAAKSFGIGMEHYDSGLPVDFLGGASPNGSSNLAYFGRGAAANRACTGLQFWLGSNSTATASSSVMYGNLTASRWTFGSLSTGANGASTTLALNDASPGISGSTTSTGNSRQSWVIARPATNGSIAVGSLAGDLIIAPESDKPLAFATVVGTTNYQIVRMRLKTNGVLNMVATPVYADNAAAISGGLVAGDEYRTSTGVKMEVYTP